MHLLLQSQVSRPPYQVLREQYVKTHLEYTAVSEKIDEQTNQHSAIMQVTNASTVVAVHFGAE